MFKYSFEDVYDGAHIWLLLMIFGVFTLDALFPEEKFQFDPKVEAWLDHGRQIWLDSGRQLKDADTADTDDRLEDWISSGLLFIEEKLRDEEQFIEEEEEAPDEEQLNRWLTEFAMFEAESPQRNKWADRGYLIGTELATTFKAKLLPRNKWDGWLFWLVYGYSVGCMIISLRLAHWLRNLFVGRANEENSENDQQEPGQFKRWLFPYYGWICPVRLVYLLLIFFLISWWVTMIWFFLLVFVILPPLVCFLPCLGAWDYSILLLAFLLSTVSITWTWRESTNNLLKYHG